MPDAPTGPQFSGRKKRPLKNRLTLFIVVAALLPLAAADVQVLWRLAQMRAHQTESLRLFGVEARKNLVEALEADARGYLAETARQGSRRMDQFLENAAQETVALASLMTGIRTHSGRYQGQTVPEPATPRVGPELHLLYAHAGMPEALREEVGLTANIRDYLLTLPRRYPALTIASVASANGFTLEIENYDNSRVPTERMADYDARKRPWYMQARARGGLVFTDIYESYYTRRNSVSAAIPYYAGGRFAGVVRLGFSLDNVNKQIRELRLAESGFAFILTPDGRVVVSPRTEGELRGAPTGKGENLLASGNASLRRMAGRMARGEHDVVQATIDGKEYLVAFEPLASSAWSFALALPVAEALRASREITDSLAQLAQRNHDHMAAEWRGTLTFLLLLHALILLAAVAAARLASVRLTRPLETLTAWATALGRGRLGQPLHLRTGDEVEYLAATLNQMRQDLITQMDELAESRAARARLLAELDLARDIQQGLLPRLPRSGFPGLDLAAAMTPARLVGGDFYDFFYLDDGHIALVMGDISDKGVPAALYMSMVKTMLKARSFSGASPARVLAQVNNALCRDHDSGMFATVFMGVLSLRDGRFVYANAGHCPPLFSPDGARHRFLPVNPALVLGIEPDVPYLEQEVILPPGAVMTLYTDGITEALDARENLYTERRFKDFLNSGPLKAASAAAVISAVQREIAAFSQGMEQCDDLTLLIIRREHGDERLTLPAAADSLDALQHLTARRLSAAGCPDAAEASIQVCCEEAFMNIACYAYSHPGPAAKTATGASCPAYGEVLVAVRAVPGLAEVEFRDRGVPFDPTAPRENATLAGDADLVGGQGIVLMRALMDEIRYEYVNGVNVLLLRKGWTA